MEKRERGGSWWHVSLTLAYFFPQELPTPPTQSAGNVSSAGIWCSPLLFLELSYFMEYVGTITTSSCDPPSNNWWKKESEVEVDDMYLWPLHIFSLKNCPPPQPNQLGTFHLLVYDAHPYFSWSLATSWSMWAPSLQAAVILRQTTDGKKRARWKLIYIYIYIVWI